MRIVITGSTGFIGGSLGRSAARARHEVIGIARRSQPDPNWPGQHLAADVAHADLSTVFERINPDVIFHGAGTASVPASFTFPVDDLRAATMSFANVLDSVRRCSVRPLVIFPSSAAIYGNPTSYPVREEAPAAPISPYGFHKLASELVAREYASCFGLDTLICRIFSVFGPAQRRLLVWEIFDQLRRPGVSIRLQGSGEESRDYLHADDLSAAILALATKLPRRNGGHHIFNLASGIETRVSDLASEICQLVAPGKTIEYLGRSLSGDPARWKADVSKTRQIIPGWIPRSLSAGLSQCVGSWQSEARLPSNAALQT